MNLANSFGFKKGSLLVSLILIPILFREVFVTTLGEIGQALSLFPLCLGMAYAIGSLLVNARVQLSYISFLFWAGWVLCLGLLYGWFSDYGSPVVTPLLGILQYFFPIAFAYLINRISVQRCGATGVQVVVKYLTIFALVTAVGALLQFYISLDLFGLISNRVYSNEENVNITRRAISFIASPQALGAFLAFGIALVSTHFARKKLYRRLAYSLIILAGIHTGSKAFIVIILVYLIIMSSIRIKLIILAALTALFTVAMSDSLSFGIDTIDRLLSLPNKIIYITTYKTFKIWSAFATYDTSLTSILAGNGIGLLATSSQSIFQYKILNGSAESFLIQLYFESGALGLTFFLIFYIRSSLKLARDINKKLGAMSFALLFNMAFTPAFFGFTFASICYIVLLFPIQKNFNKKFCNPSVK